MCTWYLTCNSLNWQQNESLQSGTGQLCSSAAGKWQWEGKVFECFDFYIQDSCDAILMNRTLHVNAGQDTKGTEANDPPVRLSPYSLLCRCVYLFLKSQHITFCGERGAGEILFERIKWMNLCASQLGRSALLQTRNGLVHYQGCMFTVKSHPQTFVVVCY